MPKQNTTGKPTTPDQQRTEARSSDSYPAMTGGSPTGLHPEAVKSREAEFDKAVFALRSDQVKHDQISKALRELDECQPHVMAEYLSIQVDLYRRATDVVRQTADAEAERHRLERFLGMMRGKSTPDGDFTKAVAELDSLEASARSAKHRAGLHRYWSEFVVAARHEIPRLYKGWDPEGDLEVPADLPGLVELEKDLRERWEQQANFLRSRNIQTEHRDGWLFTAYRRPTEQPRKTIKIVNTQK